MVGLPPSAIPPVHSGMPINQRPTSYLALPFELVLLIGENLGLTDLKSLLQVNRCLSQLLTPLLNLFALQVRYRTIAFYWAVATGNHDLITLLVEKGRNLMVRRGNNERTTILTVPEKSLIPERFARILNEGGRIIVYDTFSFCTPLHDAARHGHNRIFRLLLEMGADMTIGDIRGWTPLHHATWEDNKFAVRLLLGKGCKPDTQDSHGMTPLHLAVSQGYKVIVELLLAAGADVTLTDMRGWTAIEMRDLRSNDSMSSILLRSLNSSYRGSLMQTALHIAVMLGDVKMAIKFINEGVDINARDSTGSTALHDAADTGQIELVELLLARGAEVDIQDLQGLTPLHTSLLRLPDNIESIVMELLGNGADIATRDYDGYSILDNLEIPFETEPERLLFGYLLERTDISFRTVDDLRSLLHLAVEGASEACVLTLLDKGANINDHDGQGWTALHYAAAERTGESKIKLLIDKGANIAARSEDGKTAIDIALEMGNLTASLLEAARNVDFRTIYQNQTLLHLSVKILDLRLTATFIDMGVGIDIQDTCGRTPLHYACFGLDWDMVKLLMDRGADNTIEDKNGLTPLRELLQLMKEGSCPGEYVLLLGEGLDLCAKDSGGNTLLDLAIEHQHIDAVEVLREMEVSWPSAVDHTRYNRFKRRGRRESGKWDPMLGRSI